MNPPVLLLTLALAPVGGAAATTDVRHEPAAPKPGEAVVVTARLEKGLTKPVLKVQAVAPGKYVRKSDAGYERDWVDVPMRDDGKGVYTGRVPGKFQRHRWLIRYRIVASDGGGKAVRAPPADDVCPNFAWWCDGGPADWKGSREPGKAPVVTFPAKFLKTLQSVHLLARAEDVEKSQWDPSVHKKRFPGTVIYRAVVYDHIEYRNSGQVSAHAGGKNKWALKFNKEQHLPFVDHDGVPFPAPLGQLRLNPGQCNPFVPVLRGITGLDEVLSFRAYRLAGVPSPAATWVQWRVVTQAEEVSAKDQYAGDLWGVYVALTDMKPKLLADTKLPDGLTVTVQTPKAIKHAPKEMKEPKKVWETFRSAMQSRPKEEWWRKNLDLQAYFSFHALNRLLGNVDLRPDGNHGYYRRPDGRWASIPWDLDMMFVPRPNQSGITEAYECLSHPAIALEYRNRAREILDLFASDPRPRGGQIGQLVADLGAALTPKGYEVDWPRLDEARWNHHPKIGGKGLFNLKVANGGHGPGWTRTLATPDFAGFQKYIVAFCTDTRPGGKYAIHDGDQRGHGWGFLSIEAKDDKIPAMPTVEKVKGGEDRFEASAFSSPAGHKAAALEWRVGRVGKKGWYELHDHWRKDVKDDRAVDVPAAVFKEPGEYRVRARWRDDTGRCGHWIAAAAVSVK
jgi:hypothetical protein